MKGIVEKSIQPELAYPVSDMLSKYAGLIKYKTYCYKHYGVSVVNIYTLHKNTEKKNHVMIEWKDWDQIPLAQLQSLPLTSSLTTDNFFNLSESVFPICKMGLL